MLAALALLTALAGCTRTAGPAATPATPVIPVSKPVPREVSDFVEFTGRINSVGAVTVVARVTGYLVDIPFKEGTFVKKGQTLFKLDARPYEAQVHVAESVVETNKAELELAKLNYERAATLLKEKSISKQEFDQYKAAQEEAGAQLKSAQANLEIAKLNLEFTDVTSPIDGVVGRYFLTLGNLVNQNQSQLTTVMSTDPMYAYFDVDESTLLRIKQAINLGRMRPLEDGSLPVSMELQNESGFPHQGKVNFVNNQVNPTTGSILVRGVFANPKLKGGGWLLSPGMFVRIRLSIGEPYPALLVIDRAISTEQTLKFVYVLEGGKIQTRRVTTGPLQSDGLRVIASGVKADDRVVVGGLLQVHPGMEIQTEEVAMPSLGPAEKGNGSVPTSQQGGGGGNTK